MNDNLADTWVRTERQLLGAALQAHLPTLDVALGILTPEAFHRGSHRRCWETIQALRDRREPVDTITVMDELERSGDLNPSGDCSPAWLNELQSEAQVGHLLEDAHLVVEYHQRRRYADACREGLARAHDRTVDLDTERADHVEAVLAGYTASQGVIHVTDIAGKVLDRREQGVITRGVDTGWSDVDRLYRVVPGNLTIVAGLPGHGKSAWLDALLANLAHRHGWRAAMYSPEGAPTEEHADRLVTAQVGRRAELGEVSRALGWLHDHVAWVDHDTHTNVSQILAAVRAEHAVRPLNAFVVDPWTEVESSGRMKGEREDEYIRREVTKIRRFARRNHLHAFLVVHPKNMEPGAKGVYPIPRSHNLHGGSVWRKQADALVVIWRDEGGSQRDSALVEVVVQKVRNQPNDGRLGRTTLRFDEATLTYRQVARMEGPA